MIKIISKTFASCIKCALFLGFIFLSNYLIGNNNSQTQCIGDLQLEMNVEAPTTALFKNIIYKISVKNLGKNSKSGIIVNAESPKGTLFLSANTTSGHYDCKLKKWIIDPIQANESVELNLTVTIFEPETKIINFAWFDFSTNENLVVELGKKGASFDNKVSISITPKVAAPVSDYNRFENPNFVKKQKAGIWKMYPIIAQEKLTIELVNRSKVGEFDVDILNEFGAVVFREQISLKRGKNKVELDLHSISSGKYSIKFQDKKEGLWEQSFFIK